MDNESITVALRPARPEDDAFLVTVYAGTREDELAMTPWDAARRDAFVKFQFAAQQCFYQTEYPRARHEVILAGAERVGRLYVDRRADEIRILDLTLLPEHRGRGIGSPLIGRLMEEAAVAGKPLTISLENFNRSRRLFERLGFAPASENGFHILYEWKPAAAETSRKETIHG
ncbi:MAG: GNAT family N-acetyltransferase [Blastocatellia bacterium]